MTINCIIRQLHKMNSSTTTLVPVGVRGMKVLDRSKFLRNVTVPILKVSEENLKEIGQLCKPYCLKLEKFKPMQNLEPSQGLLKKCIHMNPDSVHQWTDIDETSRTSLSRIGVNESNFDRKEIQVTYDNWKIDTIFKAVLPENAESVSGFSQIGHIIHLNLRDHLLDYRPLIGEILIDKIKSCHTVVNKRNIIDNTYRNFSMEVISGKEDFNVSVKESQCIFKFDFSKVYWNPRLGKEHERIVNYLKAGDVLFDVFCGVGPFSVPAVKRKVKVFANDLNPDSYKYLNLNIRMNNKKSSNYKTFNMDGKQFILTVFMDYLHDLSEGKEKLNDDAKIHITMNLPASSVEFLKYFKGLISEKTFNIQNEIIVYVYCFAFGEDAAANARELVIQNMGSEINDHILDVFYVRNVAPKKEMMRVNVKLTKDILCYPESVDSTSEPPFKKLCAEK